MLSDDLQHVFTEKTLERDLVEVLPDIVPDIRLTFLVPAKHRLKGRRE